MNAKVSFFVGLFCMVMSQVSKAVDLPIEEILCKAEVQNTIKDYKMEKGEWRKTLADTVFYEAWRFHPQKLGKWLELQTSEDKIILRKFDGEKFTEAISDKECKFSFYPMKKMWALEKIWKGKTELDFDDAKLEKLLSENQKILIYLWSPKFTYSLTFFDIAKKTARKLGYRFIPLLDPRATVIEAKAAKDIFYKSGHQRELASNVFDSKMFSFDLYLRNGFNHFPVTFIVNNKKIHPRFITGLMTEGGMNKMVKDLEKELL